MGKKVTSRVSECRDENHTLSVKIPDKETKADEKAHYKLAVDDSPAELFGYDLRKLLEMVTRVTEGFSPTSFVELLKSSIPKIRDGLFPGSYRHLLMLLFESPKNLHNTQVMAADGITDHYPYWEAANSSTGVGEEWRLLDQSIFKDEVRMLRKLVAPLREELTTKSVHWITSRRPNTGDKDVQFERSLRVIDDFKTALSLGSAEEAARNRIFELSKNEWERMSTISLRIVRLDSCKATLLWGEERRAEDVLTTFFHSCRELVCTRSPRSTDWLPQDEVQCPIKPLAAQSGPDSASVDNNIDKIVQELFFKTALWLAVARGFAAAHLFCDVVRSFTRFEPRTDESEDDIAVLQLLSLFDVSSDDEEEEEEDIHSCVPPPFPYQQTLASRNLEYFQDVWMSERHLFDSLLQTSTLKTQSRVKYDASADDVFQRRSVISMPSSATQSEVS